MTDDAMAPEQFAELLGAVKEAAAHYRGEKLELRTTVMPVPPGAMSPTALREFRNALGMSQAVFAGYLNVTPKAVQAWEQGERRLSGSALALVRLGQRNPEIVFPMQARAAATGLQAIFGKHWTDRQIAAKRAGRPIAKRAVVHGKRAPTHAKSARGSR